MVLKPQTILNRLEALDAFRRPERFEKYLLACEADARGRTGLEEREYPQADFFRKALELANNIDIRTLTGQGLAGEKMAQAVRQQRLAALKNMKTH